jgi:hypothetical protein
MINIKRRSVYLITLLALIAGLQPGAQSSACAAEVCSTFSFKAASNYPVGAGPTTLAVGDFNNDDLQDLVVTIAISQRGGAAILLGTGGGRFAPPKVVDVGPSPVFILVADFNGDGKADLAAPDFSEAIYISLGRGDGSFAPATRYPAPFHPGVAIAADFNQDGKLDIATIILPSTKGLISILIGDGRGGFGAATNYELDYSPRTVAAGDFNSDGKLDLIALSSHPVSKNVTLLFGDGAGRFGAPVGLEIGNFPFDLKVDDFNGDGHVDFIVSDDTAINSFEGQVSTFLGDGTGHFGAPINYVVPSGPLAVADFNRDGKKDVASFGTGSGTSAVLFGDGAGGFTSHNIFQASGLSFDIVVGDFNNDANPDIATAGFTSDDVNIVFGDGAGGFTAAKAYIFTLNRLSGSVGLGDFNHDGHTDMAVSELFNEDDVGRVAIRLGNGAGDFGAPTYIDSGGEGASSLANADFNNDGHDDLAVINEFSENVAVRLGIGDGSFGSANVVALDVRAIFILATDFNKDGKPDLVLVNYDPHGASIMLGTGTGSFNSPVILSVGSNPTGYAPSDLNGVAAGDLNGDGNPDFVVTNHDTNDITLLFGNGAGGVESKVDLPTAPHPNFAAVGDFNGDGRADLALSHNDPGKVSILLSTGGGSFAAAVEYNVGKEPVMVVARDLNGDGKIDLLIPDARSYTLRLLRGDGLGGFNAVGNYGAGTGPHSVAVGDFKEDGRPDIAVANQSTVIVITSAPCPASVANLSFAAASYSFNEGTPSATLTVVRSGDVTDGATVNYATIDDLADIRCDVRSRNAYSRCDYATTVGVLQFTPGETSKTINIPLTNDGHVEDSETFRVALTDPSLGGSLGTPAVATIMITDNDTVDTRNPIDTTAFFVRQHYLDFLSREPEASEPWSSILNNCSNVNNSPACDRLTVSAAFFGSPEFRLKGFYVFSFYRAAFNRLPAYGEIISDMHAVTGQTPAEVFAKKVNFAANFTQRAEFVTTYGAFTNSQYVETLMARYNLTQITTPSPVNPDDTQKVTLTSTELINRLNTQTLTRAQALRAIADSDQVGNAEFSQAFVAMQYYGYLRRTPEASGYQAWLNYLNTHPSDFRTVVNGFMNSAEYRLRFGSQ